MKREHLFLNALSWNLPQRGAFWCSSMLLCFLLFISNIPCFATFLAKLFFQTVSTILQSKYLNLSYRAGPSLFIFYPSRWHCPCCVWWLWSWRHLCSRWHLHAGQLSCIELLQNREDKHWSLLNAAEMEFKKITILLANYFSDGLTNSLLEKSI